MKLATFFIKELETKQTHEINFYDSKYISVETTTIFKIFKDFLIKLKNYLFLKNKLKFNEIFNALEYNASNIFDEYNNLLISQNKNPIRYETYFDDYKTKNEIPSYIN